MSSCPYFETSPPKFKVFFLGGPGVGKSALIRRFADGIFLEGPVEGSDIITQDLALMTRKVRLQIWDMNLHEPFIPCFIRGSSVAVVVYDVTNPESFAQTAQIIPFIIQMEKEMDLRDGLGDNNMAVVLVANKTDVGETRRLVSKKDGHRRAKELGVIYCETSARNGHNVPELFRRLAVTLPKLPPISTQCQ